MVLAARPITPTTPMVNARVQKVSNQEKWFVYGCDGELVAEYAASGAAASPQKENAYRNGQLLVTAPTNRPLSLRYQRRVYFWVHGNSVKAEADFRKAIELSDGSNVSAWSGLGDSLARQGRRDEALAAYRRYLLIRPKALPIMTWKLGSQLKC